MLRAEGIEKRYSGIAALAGVDFDLEPEEIVGLVGPNGSGKSTLLGVLSGFIRPDRGTVSFEGKRINRLRPWNVARLGVRRTFQLPSQPERMTVLETMLVGAELPAGSTFLGVLVRRGKVAAEQREALERARELLDELTLLELEHEAAGSLSGGQQKLLSLGAALMSRPRALLLDEPTAGIHPRLRRTLVERLRSVNAAGTALVIVEHDMRFVAELCGRVYVLDNGEVVTSCAPSELASNRRVVEAYLGRRRRPAAVRDKVAAAAPAQSATPNGADPAAAKRAGS
jgi:branched-chain amino acid transport system ATP-binding protein